METIFAVVVIVLVLVVLGLLVWLIVSNSANAQKMAGHQASMSLLQQQLDALKTTQEDTKEKLQKSLLDGQTNISRGMQASQEVLGRLNNADWKRSQAAPGYSQLTQAPRPDG